MKIIIQVLIIFVTALCAGGLVLQASLNGALARHVESSLIAIFISFATGSLFLILVFPLRLNRFLKRKDISTKDAKRHPIRAYMVVAPTLIGLAYVTAGTIIGPVLGFNLFFVCVVTGQVTGSILVDHLGWFVPKIKVTCWRVVFSGVVLLGSILSVLERLNVQGGVGETIGLCLLSIGCGVLLAIQPPINAEFTRRMGTQPNRTALLSFFLGSCVMGIAWGVLALVDPPPSRWEDVGAWMYFGGPLGASYVVASILFAPIVGVANFFVAVIFGQLFFSTIIDAFGWFGFEEIPLTVTRGTGVLLVFLGVVGFKLAPGSKKSRNGKAPTTASDDPGERDGDEADGSKSSTQTQTQTDIETQTATETQTQTQTRNSCSIETRNEDGASSDEVQVKPPQDLSIV